MLVIAVLMPVSASAQLVDLSQPGTGGTAFTWVGPQASARAGSAMFSADMSGDVDRPDLIVGAPAAGPAGEGQVFIVFMGPPRSGTVSLSTANGILTGEASGDRFGTALSAGMIVRREVSPLPPRDLLVGAPGASGGRGAVYLFAGPNPTGTRRAAANAQLRVIGRPGDQLGTEVLATDVDGDGYRDLVLTAPGTGRIYLIFGGSGLSGIRDLAVQPADVTLTVGTGTLTLASADLNHDGFKDLAVGHPEANSSAGAVFLVKGRARAGFPAAFSLPSGADGVLSGIAGGHRAGHSLQIADFDGDGVPDLVAGAPGGGAERARPEAGEVFVLFGGSHFVFTRNLSTADVTILGAGAGHRLGAAFTAGKLRRALAADLALLAPGASTAGDIAVVYGAERRFLPSTIDLAAGSDRTLRGDPSRAPIRHLTSAAVTGKADDIVAAAPDGANGADADAGVLFTVYSPAFVANPSTSVVPDSRPTAVTAAQGSTASVTIDVANIGTLDVSWAARSNSSWLALSPASGNSTAGAPGRLTLTVTPGNLAPGTYNGGFAYVSSSRHVVWIDAAAVNLTVTPGDSGASGPTNPFGVPTPLDEGSPDGTFTPAGTNVQVLPVRDLLVTFSRVTEAGRTWVNVTNSSQASGPGVTFGAWFYQISTTAKYTGPITIGVAYDPRLVTRWEGAVRLWSGNTNITTRVDGVRHLVFGTTNFLPAFVSVADDPRGITVGRDSMFSYYGMTGAAGQWKVIPVNLDGDAATDFFLYNPSTGVWRQAINNGLGIYRFIDGGWTPNWQVTPIDLNADGFDDFLLYNRDNGLFYRVVNNRAGGFSYTPGGWAPGWTVHSGDLDGDGRTDLFLYNPVTGTWYCAFNRNDAGFQYVSGGWAPGWELHPADLNGDGKTDLFLYNPGTGQWYRALSTGTGVFTYSTGGWAAGWKIFPGHLDGDARTDLFIINPTSGLWYQVLSKPAGFQYSSGTWGTNWQLHPADLNGDRRMDLLLHDQSNGNYYKAFADGLGGFSYVVSRWSTGWTVSAGDLNGDGIDDLLLVDPAAGRWFNAISPQPGVPPGGARSSAIAGTAQPGGVTVDPSTGYTYGRWQAQLQVSPLKMQGRAAEDLFIYDAAGGSWHQVFNDGTGGFTYQSGGWSAGWQITTLDLNNDGYDDMFLYNRNSGAWYKAVNNRAGAFTYTSGGWAAGWNIYPADLDGDGVKDLFLFNPLNGGWYEVLNRGAAGFQYIYGAWAPGWQIHPVDFNGDGRTDLFLYDSRNGIWYQAIKTGPGTFAYVSGAWAPGWNVHPGDFNGDGLGDLMIYAPGSGAWYQVLSRPAGGFSYAAGIVQPNRTIVTADFNADGRKDVLFYSPASGDWARMASTGSGFIALDAGRWAGGLTVVAADLNGDGRKDLFAYDPARGDWFQALSK